MNRKIEYYWSIDDDIIPTDDLIEELEENANERIYNMLKSGYRSGELIYQDDRIEISGWWNFYSVLDAEDI